MKTPNFTKAPWHIIENTGEHTGMTEYFLANSTPHIHGYFQGKMKDADLSLIVAAPEMFETLEACLALLQDPNADEFSANNMEAKLIEIIKKAKGV